jgi:hypothetical protein
MIRRIETVKVRMEHVRASRAEIAADLAVQGFDLLQSVSAIHSLDTNEPRRLTGCRRSLRRTGSDSEGGRIATGFGCA